MFNEKVKMELIEYLQRLSEELTDAVSFMELFDDVGEAHRVERKEQLLKEVHTFLQDL